jgi:hypothetical protein
MDDPKSPIDSFDVSLGSTPPSPPAPGRLDRWNILVCSDLGFASQKPQQVRIAEWNEFLQSQQVVVSGTVPDTLTAGDKPLYVEYPVRSAKDFSIDSVEQNVPQLAAFSKALFAIRQLLDGKTGQADAAAMIARAELPAHEKQMVMSMLGSAPPAARRKEQKTAGGTPVDRILSMVSPAPAAAAPSKAGGGPRDLAGALAESVSDARDTFDKEKLLAYADACEKRIRIQAAALQDQPFFALRRASWNCLMTLARVVGRKAEASVSVFSAEADDMPQRFAQVLGWCMEQGCSPDVVLWDYDVSFSNAHAEAMEAVATAADQYKCMVLAPVSPADPLFSGISGRQSVLHVFGEVRFLPYKKLRENPHARCLCLCAPPLVLFGSANGSLHANSRSPWFAAIRWAEMLILESNPVAARGPQPESQSVFSGGPVFLDRIAPSVAAEAAARGLTLFGETLADATLDKAVTVVSTEAADASFTSFAFNLLVNRVIRQCGLRLLAAAPGSARADVAAALGDYVRRECDECGVAAGGDAVSAVVRGDGAIAVAVDSETTISGHPVRFSFSL